MKQTLKHLIYTAILMAIGILIFKYIPIWIYGKDILFDASGHIVWACFILYFVYLFIDENKSWRVPYFIFSLAVLMVISIQRIISNNHNDVGILSGLLISIISIIIPRWKEVKKHLKF